MKYKKVVALMLAAMVTCSAFAWESKMKIEDKGIPSSVNHIEFWNGGSMIFKADNVSLWIEISTTDSKLSINDLRIQFYVYKIKTNGKVISIVDSESLSILYW